MIQLTELLPRDCFVEMALHRLRSPKLIWQNEMMSPVFLEEHAYCSRLEGEPTNLYEDEKRIALSDRYGGDGIGTNGGSVRCAMSQGLQVKGVGRNRLAGSTNDYFHSYGGAALSEAVLEAIWGEICSFALPYGGVRVHGVISTSSRVKRKFPRTGQDRTTPRVLIVRDAPVRPAHFMRASFFRPHAGGAELPSDARRTQAAIGVLGKVFADAFGTSEHALTGHVLNEGISEMLRRFAWQLAAARAKRIMHGSLTASNFSVCGAWLDFTSISAVSDYGRIIIPRGAPDFMNEEQLFFTSFKNLHFYLLKYLPRQIAMQLGSCSDFWTGFRTQLDRRLQIEFTKLTGVPEWSIPLLGTDLIGKLSRFTQDVIRGGNSEPFTILSKDDDYIPEMPSSMGKYHLNSILSALSIARSPDAGREALANLLTDEKLLDSFVDCYWAVRRAYATTTKGDRQNAETFMRINALRVNAPITNLYRTNLYPDIDLLPESAEAIGRFIAEMTRLAKVQLADPVAGSVSIDEFFNRKSAVLTESDGLIVDGAVVPLPQALDQLKPKLMRSIPANFAKTGMTPFYSVLSSSNENSKSFAARVGWVTELMAASRFHNRLNISYVKQVIEPALKHRQLEIYFNSRGEPVAYVAWAFVTENVERRFIESGRWNLHVSEWNEGTALWIVDFAAPTGNVRYVLSHMRDQLFGRYESVRYFRYRKSAIISREVLRTAKCSFFSKSTVASFGQNTR